MKFLKITLFSLLLATFSQGYAQDDLLNQLDSIQPQQKATADAAFKGLQVCNFQSTKMPVKGEFYFLVTHRFGNLSEGWDNFFGLDNALTRIGGIWGVTDWLSLSVARHTYNKTYELGAKYRFANQIEGEFPVTIVGYNTLDINSELKKAVNPQLKFSNRLQYSTQLIISRKFSDSFSMELLPVYIHKNLYDGVTEQENMMLLGAGGRIKLSKRISFNAEYAARLDIKDKDLNPYNNPLTFGFDIDTGGHIFQLVFSNSQPMNDVATFTNSTGSWDLNGGALYFGFNMYRVF